MIESTMIGFEIFKRLFPFKPTEADLKRYPGLEDRFRPFTVLEIIPFFAFSGLGAYLWYRGFLALQALQTGRLGPAVGLITPTIYYWMLLALFLGMIFSAPLMRLSYRALLGRERDADYVLYNNMRAGFDTWKAVRGLAVLVVVPALGFAFLGMDTYLKVTEQGMTLNPFWSLEERQYPFTEVKAVKSAARFRAPGGRTVDRPHFIVEFSDGTTWTTRDWLREAEPERDGKLAAFIASRSGKNMQAVEMDE